MRATWVTFSDTFGPWDHTQWNGRLWQIMNSAWHGKNLSQLYLRSWLDNCVQEQILPEQTASLSRFGSVRKSWTSQLDNSLWDAGYSVNRISQRRCHLLGFLTPFTRWVLTILQVSVTFTSAARAHYKAGEGKEQKQFCKWVWKLILRSVLYRKWT
jgi:hypothetical protein